MVTRLNVWNGLVLNREARQTQANKAALNENVLETLVDKILFFRVLKF